MVEKKQKIVFFVCICGCHTVAVYFQSTQSKQFSIIGQTHSMDVNLSKKIRNHVNTNKKFANKLCQNNEKLDKMYIIAIGIFLYASTTLIVCFPHQNKDTSTIVLEWMNKNRRQNNRKLFLPHDDSDVPAVDNSNFAYGNGKKSVKNSVIEPKLFDSVRCENGTNDICEKVYNQSYISKYVTARLLSNSKTYDKYFNKKNLTIDNRDTLVRVNECDTIARWIYPKAVPTSSYNWRYVINEPDYTQRISIEVCKRQCSKCTFSDTLPNGYISRCEQIYRKIMLLTVNSDGEFEPYNYRYPSHCMCITYKIE